MQQTVRDWAQRNRLREWWFAVFMLAGLSTGIRSTWHDEHAPVTRALVLAGVAVYAVTFVASVALAHQCGRARLRYPLGAVAIGIALLYTGFLGRDWMPLYIYVAVGIGITLPHRQALITVGGLVALGAAISLASGYPASSYLWVLLSAALTGVLTSYGAERRRIKDRLQQGEQAMAQLAVNEERLRFARDLHDLLGHSLSLLALKAQLAGRLVHNDPDACARQIAEMEEISRRALAEVRESVTGYRRPTLAVELARARTSLATAGIELRSDPALETQAADLEAPREAALAWALRESVTNVLRHAAGATTCAVRLRRAGGEDVLEIQDDGHATPGTPGNGLTGLGERLALEGGRVEAGASPSGGFRVRAYVPRALRSDPGHATTQGREELRDQPSTEVQGAGRG